jgi:hypothetical protein
MIDQVCVTENWFNAYRWRKPAGFLQLLNRFSGQHKLSPIEISYQFENILKYPRFKKHVFLDSTDTFVNSESPTCIQLKYH